MNPANEWVEFLAGCARGDLNRARPTLVLPELASLSVKWAPVDSRLIQLDRGRCHTWWHRLDLDFVSDESNTGRPVSLHTVRLIA